MKNLYIFIFIPIHNDNINFPKKLKMSLNKYKKMTKFNEYINELFTYIL